MSLILVGMQNPTVEFKVAITFGDTPDVSSESAESLCRTYSTLITLDIPKVNLGWCQKRVGDKTHVLVFTAKIGLEVPSGTRSFVLTRLKALALELKASAMMVGYRYSNNDWSVTYENVKDPHAGYAAYETQLRHAELWRDVAESERNLLLKSGAYDPRRVLKRTEINYA